MEENLSYCTSCYLRDLFEHLCLSRSWTISLANQIVSFLIFTNVHKLTNNTLKKTGSENIASKILCNSFYTIIILSGAILFPITNKFKAKLTLMLKGSTCKAECRSRALLFVFSFVWLNQRACDHCFGTPSTSLFSSFITFFDLHLNKLLSEPILQDVKISGKICIFRSL